MQTLDNKTVFIPNGDLANASIINFSKTPHLRVDMRFGIGYGDDIKKAKDILTDLAKKDKRVIQDKKDKVPLVAVAELGDSSVNFEFRVWVKNSDYWAVYFDMQEAVKLAFDAAGISIPFPQRDVHIINGKTD
jgi:small conductance mechanosensitive channel